MSETEYDFDAAEAEINAKLTEHDACVLTTTYGVLDAMMKTDMVDALDHLMTDHNQLEAAELSLAFMHFVIHAGQLEAKLFHAAGIQAPPRFDIPANSEELKELEAAVRDLRVTTAVAEGEGCVRH
jgi:hypothetical protein